MNKEWIILVRASLFASTVVYILWRYKQSISWEICYIDTVCFTELKLKVATINVNLSYSYDLNAQLEVIVFTFSHCVLNCTFAFTLHSVWNSKKPSALMCSGMRCSRSPWLCFSSAPLAKTDVEDSNPCVCDCPSCSLKPTLWIKNKTHRIFSRNRFQKRKNRVIDRDVQ